MIISRTPFRISFFGGGTDYPVWYREHGGAVLATSINKYCYITSRFLPPFFERKFRLVYSKIENCDEIDAIDHPAIREVLRFLAVDRGVEIHHDADLPARSGMGSSSSFTVGLLHAMHALAGRMVSKRQLAAEAIHVEQDLIRETVGSQDQTLAAHGGLLQIGFPPQGAITIEPLTVSLARVEELDSHLMLFYTAIKRTASDIADSFVGSLNRKREPLRTLREMVDAGASILAGGDDLDRFGELLHEAWKIKRELSPLASNPRIDAIYDAARDVGALGGKLTGAGGGGFMLLFVPPHRQAAVRERLSQLIHVPFRFESSGSQIIVFDPEEDYEEEERSRTGRDLEEFRELSQVRKTLATPSD